MIDCDWVIVCDNAFSDQAGKPNLIGIFDIIRVPSVPARYAHIVVAVRLSGNPNERARITVEIVSPSGPTASADGEAFLSHTGTAHAYIGFPGVRLPDFGVYNVRVLIGGTVKNRTTFVVDRSSP